MNIYVDFDDCLCETARHFSTLAAELFGLDVPYENIRYFDLQKSFSLTNEQYQHMMTEGHKPGAAEAVNRWLDLGHDVSIITGRPYSSYEASREWLDLHGFERVRLYCLNKYGRDGFYKNSESSLELSDYYAMKFDYAVEDSPAAFRFFHHLPDLKVMVYDRPWNREGEFPGDNYVRCSGWEMISRLVK